MNVTETKLKGCFVIEPRVFNDDRGYFFESYNTNNLKKLLQKINDDKQVIKPKSNDVETNNDTTSEVLSIPIGYESGTNEEIKLNFSDKAKMGNIHGLFAGGSGSGKTNLIKKILKTS